MNEFDDGAWVSRAKAILDQSTQEYDSATLSRLNRARQAALARRNPQRLRLWFLPAGLAGACALLLAVSLWRPHAPGEDPGFGTLALPLATTNNAGSGDIELVSGDDSLEFYQDLEFYAWLNAQDQDSDG
jgi:Protein of unknown function (DUF3619)